MQLDQATWGLDARPMAAELDGNTDKWPMAHTAMLVVMGSAILWAMVAVVALPLVA